MIASEAAVAKHNLKPLARIVGYGLAGCDPTIMGIGPVPSIRALLSKSGIKLEDIDEIEINEAFGAQTLACQKELGLPLEKLNTMGGAIALGHPLGASGARISAHLVHKIRYIFKVWLKSILIQQSSMKNYFRLRNVRYGLGSACIGGGQGIAILFEKV